MSAKVYVGPGRIYEFFQKCRAGLERAPAILAEDTSRGTTIRLFAEPNAAVMKAEINDGDDVHFCTAETHTIEEDGDAAEFMAAISEAYEEFLEYYILEGNEAPAGSDSSYAEDGVEFEEYLGEPEVSDRMNELYDAAIDFLDVLMKHGVLENGKNVADAIEVMNEDEVMEFVMECAESLAGGFHVSCYIPTILENEDGTIGCVAYPFEQ